MEAADRFIRVADTHAVLFSDTADSVICPMRQGERCDARCAWFSCQGNDKGGQVASCQQTVIGVIGAEQGR